MTVGLRMKNGALNSMLPRVLRGALSRLTITALCGPSGSTSKYAVPSRRWYWPTLPKLVPPAAHLRHLEPHHARMRGAGGEQEYEGERDWNSGNHRVPLPKRLEPLLAHH